MYNNWLILDCNFLCHRAKFAMPHLEHNNVGTAIVYGFLYDVLKLQSRYPTDKIVFCWDSRHSKRKDIYPQYKANRIKKEKTVEEEETDRQYYRQSRLLRTRYLPAIGFNNIFIQKGMEGDDIIASICQSLPPGDTGTIVSSDKDLFQLLSYNVIIYNIQKQKEITMSSFKKEYGIDAHLWYRVKCLSGCTTDNVSGIKGVGDKTAIKYINGTLKDTLAIYVRIKEFEKNVIRMNEPIVKLPFDGVKKFHLCNDELSIAGWKRVVQHIGAKSLQGVCPHGMMNKIGLRKRKKD